nr:hypothetical protein [Lentzea pudingi]
MGGLFGGRYGVRDREGDDLSGVPDLVRAQWVEARLELPADERNHELPVADTGTQVLVCVRTSRTPGTCSAARTSMLVMLPTEIVLVVSVACSTPDST